MLLQFSNEMTLRACWETADLSDILVPDCWVLQGKLVCSTQGFRIALPTQCLHHQQAESCGHAVFVVTGISIPGLSEESRHLQALQLLSFQAITQSTTHHLLYVTRTLKKYHLLCTSLPGASAISVDPGPSQAPQLCTQGGAWLRGLISIT